MSQSNIRAHRTYRSVLWPAAVVLVLLMLAVSTFYILLVKRDRDFHDSLAMDQAEKQVRNALARLSDLAMNTTKSIAVIMENASDPSPFIRDILDSLPDTLPGLERAWLVVDDERLAVGQPFRKNAARSEPLLAYPLFLGVPYFQPARRAPGSCQTRGAITYPIILNDSVAGVFGVDVDYEDVLPEQPGDVPGIRLVTDNGDVLVPSCHPDVPSSLFTRFDKDEQRRHLADLLALRRPVHGLFPSDTNGRSLRVSLVPATPDGFARLVYVYSESFHGIIPEPNGNRLAGFILLGLLCLVGLVVYYQAITRSLAAGSETRLSPPREQPAEPTDDARPEVCQAVEIHDGEPLDKLASEVASLDMATGLGNVQCRKDDYEDLIRIAAGTIPATVEALMASYAAEDYERMGVEARGIGGTLRLIGLTDLAAEAERLQAECGMRDMQAIEQRFTGFLESLNQTRVAIERSFSE